jgi:hypothetical protein
VSWRLRCSALAGFDFKPIQTIQKNEMVEGIFKTFFLIIPEVQLPYFTSNRQTHNSVLV